MNTPLLLEKFDLPSTTQWGCLLETPAAVTVPLAAPKVKTVGCMFPEGYAALAPKENVQRITPRRPAPPAIRKKISLSLGTRIRPPRDVVKLEDRLFYLLQPPLENLFSNEALEFPFHPFSVSVRRHRIFVPATRSGACRRNGLGQNDAGDCRHAAARPPGAGAPHVARLPQTAGNQLATRNRHVGARAAGQPSSKASNRAASGCGKTPTPVWCSPTTNCWCATNRTRPVLRSPST